MSKERPLAFVTEIWLVGQAVKTSASHADNAGSIPARVTTKWVSWKALYILNSKIVGVDDAEGPPVPIPNTEVKLSGAENTWLETARKDREMPTQSNYTH